MYAHTHTPCFDDNTLNIYKYKKNKLQATINSISTCRLVYEVSRRSFALYKTLYFATGRRCTILLALTSSL